MVAEAVDREKLLNVVDHDGDFVDSDASVQFEVDDELLHPFELLLLDAFDDDVGLRHVDQGQGEAHVSVYVTIVIIVFVSVVYGVRDDLKVSRAVVKPDHVARTISLR